MQEEKKKERKKWRKRDRKKGGEGGREGREGGRQRILTKPGVGILKSKRKWNASSINNVNHVVKFFIVKDLQRVK